MFGDGPSDAFLSSDIYNQDESKDTLRLYAVLKDYQLDTNDKVAEQRFLDELQTWANKTNKKYKNDWGNTQGQLKIIDQDVLKQRAKIISIQLQLAYKAAATSGQTGRTLSDKDLAHFLQVVGYGIENKEVLMDLQKNFAKRLLNDVDRVDNQFKKQINNAEATEDYVTSVLKVDDSLFDKAQKQGAVGAQARTEIKRQASNNTAGMTLNFYKWVQNDKDEWEFVMLPFRERFFDLTQDARVIEFMDRALEEDEKGTGTVNATTATKEAANASAADVLGD